MYLTFDLGGREIEIDLGDPTLSDDGEGVFDRGELASYYGDILLEIDGEAYGSLDEYIDAGHPRIELRQWSPENQALLLTNPIIATDDEVIAAHAAEQEADR